MAMNPMQRRSRNSFLIGFLVALIIMAVVVLLLVNQMKAVKQELATEKAKFKSVLVTTKNFSSGQIIMDGTEEEIEAGIVSFDEAFSNGSIVTTVPTDQIISREDFENETILKVDVPAGTIVTKDMIEEVEEKTIDSDRIVEYNMLILPSTLKNGDYIDIRLLLPSGKDYIVLAKKRILGCNERTIWLKVSEDELLILNNAIVESYIINGSKLYASLYAEAGMQQAATTTYMPSGDTMRLIQKDSNILDTAKAALVNRWDQDIRVGMLDSAIEPYKTTQDSVVAGKNSEEVSSIRSARQKYITTLDESDIGYER